MRNGRLCLLAVAAAAGTSLLAFPAGSALAAGAPPTLTGEELNDAAPNVTTSCDVNGTSTI